MIEQSITRILHLSDVHIPKLNKRHDEFLKVFDNLVQEVTEINPDRIVLVGDLFHDKLNISNEALKVGAYLLNSLASISRLIITRGNHDFQLQRRDRLDCVQTIVDLIQNPNITYYNKSGFHIDENIVWVVWHHGDHYSPWNELQSPIHDNCHLEDINAILERYGAIEDMKSDGYKFVDLFHDPINGCKMFNGMALEKDTYVTLDAFKGDVGMFGDIHCRNLFSRDKIKHFLE